MLDLKGLDCLTSEYFILHLSTTNFLGIGMVGRGLLWHTTIAHAFRGVGTIRPQRLAWVRKNRAKFKSKTPPNTESLFRRHYLVLPLLVAVEEPLPLQARGHSKVTKKKFCLFNFHYIVDFKLYKMGVQYTIPPNIPN